MIIIKVPNECMLVLSIKCVNCIKKSVGRGGEERVDYLRLTSSLITAFYVGL